MFSRQRPQAGFTLVELMVAVAVLIILTVIALPSFEAVRQRSSIRGAADQTIAVWNQARLEALKRNQMVKVGMVISGTDTKTFCIGAATTTSSTDSTPCDCLTAGACDVAQYPPLDSGTLQIAEWRNVTLLGATLGGGTDLTTLSAVVLDPRRLFLTESGDAGTVTLKGPVGVRDYRINLSIDRFGRGYLCESTAAPDSLSDYSNTNRRCAP